jgi:peptidoglycan/LPS O-acetylase OafA/YrhL
MKKGISREEDKPKSRILALTSLRFFAAFYVLLFHTGGEFLTAISRPAHLSLKWLNTGYASVSFFFVLSGYILAHVYLKDDQLLTKKGFWIARFARVYPLFLATLILDTPNLYFARLAKYGFLSATAKTSVTFFANVFMLQAWSLSFRGINDPNWSLAVETIFYLAFPWIGVRLWKLRLTPSIVAFLMSYAIGMFAVVAAIHLGFVEDRIKFNPFLHLNEFISGILLARIHAFWLKSAPNMASLWSSSFVLLGSILFFCVVLFSNEIPLLLLHDGLMTPIFSLFILGFASRKCFFARPFKAKSLVLLGEASFGLYLIHIPIWHLVERAKLDTSVTFYPVYVACCVGLSIASFYYLETPMRRFILKRFHVPSKETTASSSIAQ